MNPDENIQSFLEGKRFAVVGASTDRSKYGNKVLRAYLQNGLEVVPVNPKAERVEGVAAVADLDALDQPVDGISIITPPNVTEKIVEKAVDLGIKNIWMQPGAESDRAVEVAEQSGANVIQGGPCLLVVLRFRDV